MDETKRSVSESAPEPTTGAPRATVVLGTMNFGKRTKADEAERVVARAIERGVREFDTANAYQDGEAERILGKSLRAAGARDDFRVTSKAGLGRVQGKAEGLSSAALKTAVEGSLQRLGVGHLDALLLHAPDEATGLQETVEAVGELVAQGHVREWGVSNFSAWKTLELVNAAKARGVAAPCRAQQMENLLVRQVEVEYVAFAQHYGIAVEAYNPLAGGLLSGRYDDGGEAPKGSRFAGNALYRRRYFSPRLKALSGEYAALARELGLTPLELAYAWLAGTPWVDAIVIGPAEVAHLDAALDAREKTVDDAARRRVDVIYANYLGTDARYAR